MTEANPNPPLHSRKQLASDQVINLLAHSSKIGATVADVSDYFLGKVDVLVESKDLHQSLGHMGTGRGPVITNDAQETKAGVLGLGE